MRLFAVAGLLAGCSAAPTGEDAAPLAEPTPAAVALTLDPLTGDHAPPPGELRCGFQDDAGQPLLLAGADVGSDAVPAALVSIGGEDQLLRSNATGGFGALERGGSFTAGALTATLTRGEKRETGHEGSRFRATLTVARGAARFNSDGWWSCGP